MNRARDHYTDLCDQAAERNMWIGLHAVGATRNSDDILVAPGYLSEITIIRPPVTDDSKPIIIHKVKVDDGDLIAAARTLRQRLGAEV